MTIKSVENNLKTFMPMLLAELEILVSLRNRRACSAYVPTDSVRLNIA